jgi:hypothetical protein
MTSSFPRRRESKAPKVAAAGRFFNALDPRLRGEDGELRGRTFQMSY